MSGQDDGISGLMELSYPGREGRMLKVAGGHKGKLT